MLSFSHKVVLVFNFFTINLSNTTYKMDWMFGMATECQQLRWDFELGGLRFEISSDKSSGMDEILSEMVGSCKRMKGSTALKLKGFLQSDNYALNIQSLRF